MHEFHRCRLLDESQFPRARAVRAEVVGSNFAASAHLCPGAGHGPWLLLVGALKVMLKFPAGFARNKHPRLYAIEGCRSWT